MRIQLEAIRDNMANCTAGYSFVNDPANKLADAYLNLANRACLNPLHGLMSSERWNIPAVNKYLEQERALVSLHMLILYILTGQAPRSRELFSIECENGCGSLRGIYVYGA